MAAARRYVSRLTRDTLALILAGGRGSRLKDLTDWRAKPGVPFGGKFRIIDFPLSNCINSGIRQIGVLTQYKAHSLIKHIQQGWSFLRAEVDEFVEVLPAQQRTEPTWYAGTADAIYQNLDIIRSHEPEYVLILAGDHIYKMDYGPMIAFHVEQEADLTVGCIEVPIREASAFGVMKVVEGSRITRFDEKPEHPEHIPGNDELALASMGIYVFNTKFLFEQLIKDHDQKDSMHDFGHNIIPSVIANYRVMAYPFRDVQRQQKGYWRDVGTVDAFWQANLELTDAVPELNLYDTDWPIWTYQEQLPPAKFIYDEEDRLGFAVNSMISGGCIVTGGIVRHSLLFSNVRVGSNARINDSVILPDVDIGRNCRIQRAVIDKFCHLPEGTIIGEDLVEDAKRYYVSPGGVVLVTPEMLQQEVHHVR
ncbi:MAG: glucose-1-phosphate adenylyltransferase [Acidithiobacillales bacterium SG8_45]|jgi:glucose-1-phosphate adenylyltransferase|nr:MAG: glucose-1-phosphate adenylyltransferase [Acidithiobacillales bacterium SG8_45]